MALLDHFKKQNKTSKPTAQIAAQTDHVKLIDFHPGDAKWAEAVRDFEKELRELNTLERRPGRKEQFWALLAGIAALRKTPGIPGPGESGPNYFITLPRCATPEDTAACRAHLKKVFGITDKASLLEFCKQEILCNYQYQDFLGFWEGRPPFPIENLNEGGLKLFMAARDFSAQFYPIVGQKGYLGWDISECMGHLRAGYACGLLDQEEFNELAEYWADQAQVFADWTEFAVSVICGELYWEFRNPGCRDDELSQGFELWKNLTRFLLDNDAAWASGLWYIPSKDC